MASIATETTCVVHVSPETVDAGVELTIVGAVSCSPPCDLRGHTRGVAELRIAKGVYKLFVAQSGHATFGVPLDVTADMTVAAKLCVEQVLERN